MLDKIKDLMKKSYMWVIGFVIMVVYVYSNMIIGDYQLGFTNVNYAYPPWDSLEVETNGPHLSDVADTIYPQLYKTYYMGDKLSLWNAESGLGAENGIDSAMYPLNYVYFLNIKYAVILKSVLEFLIAFIAMYLFLKEIGISKFPASIGGLLYCFSSIMVVWHGWQHSDVTAFAPFAFMLVEKIIKHIKIRHALWLSLVIYIMLIAGMPTYAAYYLYLLGAYIVVETIWKYKKDIKSIIKIACMFGMSVILGAMASLPYTIGLLTGVGNNGYSESRMSEATETLPIGFIRTMILPLFRKGLPSLHVNESTIFIGLFIIVLLPFTFAGIREKKKNIFFVLSSIVLSLLVFTHIFDGVFKLLPVINSSVKYRLLVLFNFTMIINGIINLNHLINNREYYKKNKIWLALGIVFAGVISYITIKEINVVKDIRTYEWTMCKTIIILIGLAVLLVLQTYIPTKIWLVSIMLLAMWDMGGFANDYLPWISKDADVIPEKTDSIRYLEDNTDYERVTAEGAFTLFANSNIYYNLYDVRSHSFVNTNEDIYNYIGRIDDEAFTTSTRVCFEDIENYNLLKYMGVKYIAGTEVGVVNKCGDDSAGRTTLGTLHPGMVIEQNVTISRDKFTGIDLLFATYGNTYESDKYFNVEIIDADTENLIGESEIKASEIRDNTYYRVYFDSIENSEGTKCIVRITVPIDFDMNCTLWKNRNDSEGNELYVNNIKESGSIAMNTVFASEDYGFVYYGNDGLDIIELSDYAERFALISKVDVMDEEDILDSMSEKYEDNTLFLTENTNNVSLDYNELAEDENIELTEYSDDYIKLNYSIDTDRYILINDYYADGWNAYINNKKVNIEKGNYLFRAVYAEEGSDMVLELKYEPKTTIVSIYICIGTISVTVVLIAVFSIIDYRKKKANI